jgi:hypothetical protein
MLHTTREAIIGKNQYCPLWKKNIYTFLLERQEHRVDGEGYLACRSCCFCQLIPVYFHNKIFSCQSPLQPIHISNKNVIMVTPLLQGP